MYEVELQDQAQALLDVYVEAYEKRYRVKPALRPAADTTSCKDLIRQIGFDKAVMVVRQYLKQNDKWFIQKAHGLDVLKSNLNVVITQLPREVASPKSVKVRTDLSCDSCWKKFYADFVWVDLQEYFVRCPDCMAANKPWRYPTREEFDLQWKGSPSYDSAFRTKDPVPHHMKLLQYNFRGWI